MPKKLVTPEPLLYVEDKTAKLMGLTPTDIVEKSAWGKYVFLENKEAVADIALIREEFKRTKRGKDENAINRPIIAVGADGVTPLLMIADNSTDPLEVQDIIGAQLEKQEATIKRGSVEKNETPAVDTDWVRVVNGLPIGNKRVEMVHDAFQERIQRHKRNMVSDPPRDPWKQSKEDGTYVNKFQSAEIPKEENNESSE